jgi:hypothetical protein
MLFLGGISSCGVATFLSGAPLTWSPGPSLGTPMSGCSEVVNHGNNILAGGDANEFYFYPLTQIVSLAATNSYWSYVSSYDALNIAGGAVVSDGNVVVYGGTDGTNSQDITIAVSLSGDVTPPMPNMKVARSYLGYAPDKNANAFAFGGLDASGNALASAEKLNPTASTPAWAYIASMPGPRYSFPAVFNRTNYIYIFGGLTNPATGLETASVLRYSVSGNSWSNMAPMLVAVANSAATLGQDGKIYVAGGTVGGVSTDVVQVYDPAANSWSLSTPLPEALSLAAMGVDSLNRLIVMGGVDSNGNDVADVWRSQPFGVPDSAPVITQLPATTGGYLAAYSSSIFATGSPSPTYSLVSGPGGMSVDYYTGAISWTPQGLSQIGVTAVTVQAANYAGTTNYSFTITVPNPPPTPPANLTVVGVTESSVSLSWSPEDPVAGAVTYSVWLRHVIHDPRGSGETIWYTQIGSSTTDTIITIGGLAAGLSQAYYVKATGPGGSSGYSVAAAATLTAPPPTNIRITSLTSTSITLEWDAPAGGFPIASYRVLGWFNGIAAQYPLSYSNIQGTGVTLSGLAPGNAMLWGVAALDTAGNVTTYDYLSSLVVNPMPQRATLAAVFGPQAPGGFQFTVQVGTAQTIFIQATTTPADPSSWQTIATNPPAATTFTFTDPNSSQYPIRFYRTVCP